MAHRFLDRLKRSLLKDQLVGIQRLNDNRWEAELAEDECVTDRLVGTLCFSSEVGEAEVVDGDEGEESEPDSDSDFQSESVEEGLSSTGDAPLISPSPSAVTRQLQERWRNLRGLRAGNPVASGKRILSSLLFEVTDASVVQDGSSKYVLYTIQVCQSGGSDKTPAVITSRYSDFQRLHATLRRNHGDQMAGICFPRKKLRSNFTAETIAKRSRAFEQYLYHLCSLDILKGALCVRHFFYLNDLQTGQLVGRYQDALGPLLNAKRLQEKLGWATFYDSQTQTPPLGSTHWFFTLVGLACCFQEEEQLEEAWSHCDLALHVLTPAEIDLAEHTPTLPTLAHRPHPLLQPLLRAVVRLSWQIGRDKQRWEELLQQLDEQWAGVDNQPTIKEFLVKHNLQDNEDNLRKENSFKKKTR
uniref:Sorting nexin family member 21 n=1 Tax=Cynoglossus semilaevis TaxID=244447 RepID=A0A3P8WWH7_CYNSE